MDYSIKLYLCALFGLVSIAINAQTNKDSLAFLQLKWEKTSLDNGIEWRSVHTIDSSLFVSKQNLNVVLVPRTTANFNWALTTAGDSAMSYTSRLAYDHTALAAINGSFFNTKTGQSVDFIKVNGTVKDTSYTETNGKYRPHQQAVVAFDGTHPFEIIARDTTLGNTWEKCLPMDNVLESGPLLIYGGKQIVLPDNPFNSNRHPRTCVGMTPTHIVLLTADGRNTQAYGLSLPELADIMSWMGCHKAVNFDGGGSTTMYLAPHGVVNMPSDNKLFDHEGERKVSNVLMLIPKNK